MTSTPKSYSLDEFITDTQIDLDDFKKQYLLKHQQQPENYPLELNEDNSGLWLEFFMSFITDKSL